MGKDSRKVIAERVLLTWERLNPGVFNKGPVQALPPRPIGPRGAGHPDAERAPGDSGTHAWRDPQSRALGGLLWVPVSCTHTCKEGATPSPLGGWQPGHRERRQGRGRGSGAGGLAQPSCHVPRVTRPSAHLVLL